MHFKIARLCRLSIRTYSVRKSYILVSDLKTRLREQRDERILLEKKHDERLSRLQKQMNDEGVRRASELRAATVQIGTIAAAEQGLRDKQLNDETEKARGELGKKEKSVKSKNWEQYF